MNSISTYVINLEKRTDRKMHLLKQFKNKKEFDAKLVKAIENENGAIGLWQTILHIIEDLAPKNTDYILICEDDHQFTKNYSIQTLQQAVREAKEREADVLLGGVSWFMDALELPENIFWIDRFTGTQFMVVFSKFYSTIINADFNNKDTADKKICSLTPNKFLIYPFISTQKEFGYSDATQFNNKEGYVTKIFEKSDMILSHIVKANTFYQNRI